MDTTVVEVVASEQVTTDEAAVVMVTVVGNEQAYETGMVDGRALAKMENGLHHFGAGSEKVAVVGAGVNVNDAGARTGVDLVNGV